MSQKLNFEIKESEAGQRLDKFLSVKSEIGSRSRAETLLEADLVLVNQKVCKASYKVKAGDLIECQIPAKSESQIQPLDLKLDILFEDSDIIVVNKPANLVIHPAAGHESDTLVNALVAHSDELSMKFGEDRPGIVHRLDKDTSGVLVVAKNDFAHEGLAQQFSDRTIHRLYEAMTLGIVPKTSGFMESHLGRDPKDRKKFASVPNGKWAKTNYKKLNDHPAGLSLIELKLETGRTHQIRVHLSEAGFPVLGDAMYNGNKWARIQGKNLREEIAKIPRFALHAKELGFIHPRTKEAMSFKVPWPKDLQPFLKLLEFSK